MLMITFANGKTYPVHEDTTIYPSGNRNIRNRMEIHIAEDKITFDNFIALVSDEKATMTMRHTMTDDANKIIYDHTYTYYIALAEVGKRRCDVVNVETGEVRSEYHLVAVLEQLTETEQKLRELEK